MDLAACKALMGHCEWADAQVWNSVLTLPGADAELRGKLHHLHMVQWAYLQIWQGTPVTPCELDSFATDGQLRAWARDYYRELTSYLATVGDDATVEAVRFPWADRLVKRFGGAVHATWAESVLQVAMHSTYHRGQVARRLRELEVEPPLTDFIAWIWQGRPLAEWGDEDAA
jgi:uncharacterized damage-inducible protein DinB